MRQLIAGNWKMNGISASLAEIESIARTVTISPPHCDVLICPPATLLSRAVERGVPGISFGGQDCHPQPFGAFTGDLSAEMLRDCGASAVIVGHSERRQFHSETDELIASKASAAWSAGLSAIICIGETLSERQAHSAELVCERQLAGSIPSGASVENTVIAYEPVWAIGTGRTPANNEIAHMHAHIRKCLGSPIRILYGGSVKSSNSREILSLPNVDGALVGGASLRASEFMTIVGFSQASS